jgi:hypothetical protein
VIPPLVNTFIGFFKDTSLVLIIGIFDLLTAGKTAIVEPAWQGFGSRLCRRRTDLSGFLLRDEQIQPGPGAGPEPPQATLNERYTIQRTGAGEWARR